MSKQTARTHRAGSIVLVLSSLMLLPAAAAPPALASEVIGDYDARAGVVQPTAQQQQMVSSMGASAIWSDFGTPSSLIKYGGYLASGLSGPDAATVARNWVNANKALFRLSSLDGLKLANDSRMAQSDGHAVLFRQEFGGLEAAQEGTITVGITGTPASGWKIAYASASTTGDTALAGAKRLSPQEAWMQAAADVGRAVSVSDIRSAKADGEWTIFAVDGFGDVQRARERALPTPTDGVVPVFETIVLESAAPLAYKHYVDARSGEVLVRQNLVMQSHEPVVQAFTGNVPNVDGGCGPLHGPYTPEANGDTVSFSVLASGDVPALDIVLKLFRNGTLIQAADTATSPELIHYEPSGGVPAGDYFVQVCEFQDGAAPGAALTGYSGTIARNDVAGGSVPYPPKWKVFPANPLLGNQTFMWNYPSTDSRKKWCWDSVVNGNPVSGCEDEIGNLASRAPWDADPFAGFNTPTFTTRGNNAEAREAWISPDTVVAGVLTPGATGFQPVDPNRDYDFEWSNDWFNSGCDKAQVLQVGVGNDISAAAVNLFSMHNRMHDWSYFLGFTEENWNAQDVNFGLTSIGRQNDRLIGDVQVGGQSGGAPTYGGRDNANMIPLPDGIHPITNMYLWQPLAGAFYAPCVDGDYDMAVIGHEYTHLIENRMIGKGGTRTGHHAGAMGESNADLNAVEILNEYSFVPVSDENRFAVGAYVTGNKGRAIRNYGMNFPRTGAFPEPGKSTTESGLGPGPKVNPLNFSDLGYDLTGGQVHADGEIWSATNHDIRQALVAKYNSAYPASDAALQRKCADGKDTPDHCPGNRRWIQIVYDAYLLMVVDPSMLVARDAYLAADVMRFGGANQNELWLAFARRGFGQYATSSNQLVNSDTDPKPDFASPIHGEATVTFRAVASNEGNAAVNARVYVGHYEARVSPIAVTGTAASGSPQPDTNNLDNRALFVPGTYEFVAHAPGYGHVRFARAFSAGSSTTVTINMPSNWASKFRLGVTVSGDGTASSLPDLIDDTEATNWDDPAGGLAVNVSQPQVTVKLAQPRTVNRVQVSAMLLSQNRFTALRQFRIEVSTNNGTTFNTAFTSATNAFPGFNPRPVAPEMILRSFSFGAVTGVTHVRIRVLHNQCTGNAAFQGEQDNDITNNTDCTQGSSPNPVPVFGDLPDVLAPRHNEVHIAELQVFSSTGGAGGGGDGEPPPPPPGGGNDCDVDDDVLKLGPAVASPGSSVEFTVTYTNLSDIDDDDCEIDDLLPDDLTYVSSTGGGTYDAATRTVTWTTGRVAAGETKTFNLTATVSDSAGIGSVLINQAYFRLLGIGVSPLGTATTLVVP